MSFMSGIFRCTVIIDSFISRSQANRFWMLLFDILSHKTNLSAVIPLIFKFINWLTIKGLTNDFLVIFKPLVRKERSRLCGCRCRSTECACTLGNIGQELGCLEWISLLLQELIVKRRQASLFGLLLCLTCRQLSLRAREASCLCTSTQIAQLRSCLCKASQIGLLGRQINTLLLLCCGKGRIVSSIKFICQSLLVSHILLIG